MLKCDPQRTEEQANIKVEIVIEMYDLDQIEDYTTLMKNSLIVRETWIQNWHYLKFR